MKTIFLTTASDESKCDQLKRSLNHFGWEHHFIIHEWKGFGSKITETYHYLKAHPEVTHFFYTDAYDTFCLGTMEEALSKIENKDVILFGAEKACYPHPHLAELYPDYPSPWKYLNGGNWFASSERFCQMVERAGLPELDINDQAWFTTQFLNGHIKLDYDCKIFQTMAFESPEDFWISTEIVNIESTPNEISGQTVKRIENELTGSKPVFFHGNGHTPIDHIYKLLP